LNSFLSSPLLGIDIQPGVLRLAQLRKKGKRYLVEFADRSPLPREAFGDGKINNFERIGSYLEERVKLNNLNGLASVIQIPLNLVRIQQIQLPANMSHDAIREEIKVKLEKDFPGLLDSLLMDYVVETPTASPYSNVYFTVTRKEYVLQYVDCIHAAGLKVKVVDIDLFALKRLFHLVSLPSENKVDVLICERNETTELIIYSSYQILFHQQWHAETEVELMLQLKNRLSVFLATFPNQIIRHIHIYTQHIFSAKNNTELNYPVNYVDPFSSIELSHHLQKKFTQENLSDYLTAFGLAMREVPKW
jgi:type IV pilus assembly protein PilM